MFSYARLVGAALVAALLAQHGAMAQDEPAAPEQEQPGPTAPHDTYLLDEYNIDVFAAPDSGRIGFGLGFGTEYANGLWWTAGPRLSYVQWSVDVAKQDGLGLGGAFGFGWRPEKMFFPYSGIVLSRDFSVGGVFDWQAMVHAGARMKVTRDAREYFTMTFSVYHANVFGGDGPAGDDTGVALMYSAVLYAKHR
jgi:hypothetical protein